MEAEMRAAKQRSEGMRAQAAALRARGERHDMLLGCSPEKSGVVPKLNLAGLGQKAEAPGRLGQLMSKAKEKVGKAEGKKVVSPKASSPKSHRKGSSAKSAMQLKLALPTIDTPSSSDADDDVPEIPLSRAALLGSLTAREKAAPVVPALSFNCYTPRSMSSKSSSLQPATARVPSYGSNTRPMAGGRNMPSLGPCKKLVEDDLDDLLADLSV